MTWYLITLNALSLPSFNIQERDLFSITPASDIKVSNEIIFLAFIIQRLICSAQQLNTKHIETPVNAVNDSKYYLVY